MEIHLEMLRNELETYFTTWMESVFWMIRESPVGGFSTWMIFCNFSHKKDHHMKLPGGD